MEPRSKADVALEKLSKVLSGVGSPKTPGGSSGPQAGPYRSFRKTRGRKRKDGSEPEQKTPSLFEEKMKMEESKSVLKRRGAIVEAVFGQIKTIRGATRFMIRGITACASEWKLLCTTHNLLKLFRARIKAK